MGTWSPGPGATSGDDTYTGDSSGENVAGLAGNDVLNGNDGNDTLDGGTGIDQLFGGAGADVLLASSSGQGAGEIFDGGADADTISLVFDAGNTIDLQNDTVTSIENITFNLGASSQILDITAQQAISGFASTTHITGNSGADQDVIIIYASGPSTVDLSSWVFTAWGSNDELAFYGSSGADTFTGNTGNDDITGFAGDDHLNGGDGNDSLFGDAGADTLNGGNGSDAAHYDNALQGVVADLAAPANNTHDAAGDVYISIENLVGSYLSDTLRGDANANLLNGLGGNDTLVGQDGDDALYGSDGNDTLQGGNGDDYLNGGAGADALAGGAGADWADYSSALAGVIANLNTGVGTGGEAAGDTYTSIENIEGSSWDDVLTGRDGFSNILDGGYGNDTIEGGTGADDLNGGPGADTLSYEHSFNAVDIRLFQGTAAGGAANGDVYTGFENIIGSAFTDTLAGDDGVNVIHGGAGNETETGRDGNDQLFGDAGNDTLLGGNGADVLVGGAGNDTLGGGSGNDTADYSASNVGINVSLQTGAGSGGDAQGDTLVSIENVIGSAFADTIAGKNNWDNVLDGGAGADTLSGGTGNDTFVFHAGEANGDTILDFSHTGAGNHDHLEFDGYGTAAAGATFVQIDATHWQINSADGTIHETIVIANGVVLTAGDYIFGG